MSLYTLYAASTTSTDSAASLDIREDGMLEDITIEGFGGSASANVAFVEVSFGSTSQFAANDTLTVIGRAGGVFSTSPGTFAFTMPCKFKVAAGDRIFMHIYAGGTLTSPRFYAYLNVSDNVNRGRPAQRR